MPVMDIAGATYASGTFWAGAGVVVAALATVAGVWVTFSVGFPRRRLYFGLRATAPLLTAPVGMRSHLELRHRGTTLADPHVLTVDLISRGRKDIPSDAYNDRQPLQLDVGARIVEILQVTSEPQTLQPPQIATDGTLLRIGPSLIGRRQAITINVLTDSGEPSLTCRSPLIDVQVRQRTDAPLAPAAERLRLWALTLVWLLAGAGLLAAVGGLTAVVTGGGKRVAAWTVLAVLVAALVVSATRVRRR
jgi:hypothetical protein